MYKPCSGKGPASRQQIIEECLLDFMQTSPYSEITVNDICEKAGIPRKSFYRYFTNKDSVLHSLIERILMEYESFPGDYRSGERRTVRRDLERMFLYWRGQAPLLNALDRNGMFGRLFEQSIRFSVSPDVLPRRFLPEDSEDMRLQVTAFSAAGLMSIILAWYRQGFSRSANQEAAIAQRVLTQPLFPDPERFI